MANIFSSYPAGQSVTSAELDGKDPTNYLQALLEREASQRATTRRSFPVFKKPMLTKGVSTSAQVTQRRGGGGEGGGDMAEFQTAQNAQRSADAYDASVRGAATRPVGLGAQMIPGMQVNQELLPTRLRIQSSQFQNPTIGPSMAGVTPTSWQEDFYNKFGYWPSQAQQVR